MPLFNHSCHRCGYVFEALVDIGSHQKVPCRRCGAESKRSEVSLFQILGVKQTAQSAKHSSGTFATNADSFVSTMNDFGDSVGDRLSNRQMERAVENLRKAKR